jgi:hypothetical protein
MTHRPGPRQREILRAMRNGAWLALKDGQWYVGPLLRRREARACVGLRDHGHIMFDGFVDGAARWVITEQGKAACD